MTICCRKKKRNTSKVSSSKYRPSLFKKNNKSILSNQIKESEEILKMKCFSLLWMAALLFLLALLDVASTFQLSYVPNGHVSRIPGKPMKTHQHVRNVYPRYISRKEVISFGVRRRKKNYVNLSLYGASSNNAAFNDEQSSPKYDDAELGQFKVIVETSKDTEKIKQLIVEDPTLSSPSPEPKLTSKPFNAFLLLACFGFAVFSILSVDDGMTRGWSITEKAMRIPLDNWSSYESSLNQQPIFTKTTINVVIYLLGDWLSQTLFVKKDLLEFDAWRTLRNGFIGMVFGPLVHEYYEFSDHILPVEEGFNRFYKIAMDQSIYIFTKCSVYIIAVNMLAGESWEYSSDAAKGKIKGIMLTAWKFWPLVHCVTYGAIPARHRILWVNCIDLFWNAILASMTSSNSESNDDQLTESKERGEQEGINNDDLVLQEMLTEVLMKDSDIDKQILASDSVDLLSHDKL